jgi:uncharacterized protein (DUF849 family)
LEAAASRREELCL